MRLLVLSSFVVGSLLSGFSFADLWWTPDQQGRRAYDRADYVTAGERFEDPMWKGSACYRAEDWACAVDQFARLDSAEAYFNLANSYARQGEYELSIEAYDRALERRAEWIEATENRALVVALMEIPEEEEEEQQGPPQDPHYTPDEVKFDDKGKDGKEGKIEQSMFTDEQIAEMWLRGVQTTPAEFLYRRFAFEAADRESEAEGDGP